MVSGPILPVVVVAASTEGIHALARLLYQLPSGFPALVVAVVHGLGDGQLKSLARNRPREHGTLPIAAAVPGVTLAPGRAHVASATEALVFTAVDILGTLPAPGPAGGPDDREEAGADRLFESAARFHGDHVIGVVLSGSGHDGTRGLLAITGVNGIRVVQTPCEAAHPAMPFHALMNDHVHYSVVLDDMGRLLCELVEARLR